MERIKDTFRNISWAIRAVHAISCRPPRSEGPIPIIREELREGEIGALKLQEGEHPQTEEDINKGLNSLKEQSLNFTYPPRQIAHLLIPLLIQFTDETGVPPPQVLRTYLPSQQQIESLEQYVLNSEKRVTVIDIFNQAIDLTNNDVFRALLLCMITTRHRARLSDQLLIYWKIGNIPVEKVKSKLKEWSQKLLPFAGTTAAKDRVVGDAAGDYYYFFTSAIFGYLGARYPEVLTIGRAGPAVMRLVRALVSSGTVSPHEPAASWGLRFGRALAQMTGRV